MPQGPLITRLTATVPLLALGVLALGPLAACGEPNPAAEVALTRADFIDVVVALRNAEILLRDSVPDSILDASYEAARDSILLAHGASEAGLDAFLDRHPGIEYQEALWDSITQRLKRPRGELREGPGFVPKLGEGEGPPELPGRGPAGEGGESGGPPKRH